MYRLGYAAIVASFLLGGGGVAYDSRADSLAGVCPSDAATHADMCTEKRTAKTGRASFIPLNSKGYNYSKDDGFRPEVPSTKSPRPAGATPRRAVATSD